MEKRKNMRILHYMFGIPPVRTGGLVRYASDLMLQQKQMGMKVSLLIPGALPLWQAGQKTSILKSRRDYLDIPTYTIRHPLPIPMCNGIVDARAFTQQAGTGAFRDFLRKLRPQVIHIHTWMGLHREFVIQAKKLGIPVIFTTHDYFGLCPTALLLRHGQICRDQMWRTCTECCGNAFSKGRLWLEQTWGYRQLRKNDLIIELLKKAAGKYRQTERPNSCRQITVHTDYAVLRDYYTSMFRMVSWFHFNSSLARDIYESRLGKLQGSVLSISHLGIADHRKRYTYGKTLRLGYFGSWTKHKGFYELLKACTGLYEKGYTDMELHLYSGTESRSEVFVRNHPGFQAGQLAQALGNIDVLVVPGIWTETFGLVVLEALSYGVPVIVSRSVGAKDLLFLDPKANTSAGRQEAQRVEYGFVYDGTRQGLQTALQRIYEHRELLEQANACMMDLEFDFSYQVHVNRMLAMYRKVIQRREASRQIEDTGDRHEISKGIMGIQGNGDKSCKA